MRLTLLRRGLRSPGGRAPSFRDLRFIPFVGVGAVLVAACSSGGGSSFGDGGGGGGDGGGTGTHPGMLGNPDAGGGGGGGGTVAAMCPAGTTCDVSCTSGTTTVSGTVYDPAGKNPLYGVEVFVPGAPLTPLPGYMGAGTPGVPMGGDSCSCGALFPEGAVVSTVTKVDGTFTLTNVPVGSSVPLVLQVGKWRRSLHIPVTACTANAQADTSLTLPGTVPAGDTDDNMPNIAVSTGMADSLECLLVRIGVSPNEYVAGTSTAGHVHVFAGGSTGLGGGFGDVQVGEAEPTPMPGEPASYQSLWQTPEQLYPFDVVLLSCEGGETYNAVPDSLQTYLNAGGRVFASHYHYAWFAGPLGSGQSYAAPPGWGSALAQWSDGASGGGGDPSGPIGGVVDQTLNSGTGTFQKGQVLDQWLGENGALGTDGVPAGELSIYEPRYNATVTPANSASQPWITADQSSGMGGSTMYFSFDTPVGATNVCGRAVFSDLHVSGNKDNCGGNGGTGHGHGGGGGEYVGCDNQDVPPPTSCAEVDLSPQEKALEFMLFDLSSCVIPDTSIVSPDAGFPPPPASK